jgi:hypothetical protein
VQDDDPLVTMQRDGFAVLHGALEPELVTRLHDAFVELNEARRDLGMRVGEARLMLPVPIRPPFCDEALCLAPKIHPLLMMLLGEELLIASYGSVVSLPGAPGQHLHKDHEFLFPLPLGAELPCHAVTLVVPLVDIDRTTGTTALYPGSHRTPDTRGITPLLPWMTRGDCFLMDYRLSHGGTPNPGQRARPLLYIVFSRPWFVDNVNFKEVPPLQLSPAGWRSLPEAVQPLFRRAQVPAGSER